MINSAHQVIEKAVHSDKIGQIIVYGGGSTVAATSKIMETLETTAEVAANWGLWIASMCVLGRLVFDVVKWVTERKDKKR